MRVRFVRSVMAMVLLATMTVPTTTSFADSPPAGPVYLKAAGLNAAPATLAALDVQGAVAPQASSAADAMPLSPSPVAGSLAAQGTSTLYSIDVPAGSRIELSLTGTGGVFDLYLFAPGLGSLAAATAVAHACMGGYPRALSYDVPPEVGGTYYVEVFAYQGTGDYLLSWIIRPESERARIDVPEATAISLPFSSAISIPDELQANVLYRFSAAADRRIQVDLSGPVGADFDLYLYAPGTGTILPATTQPVASANERTATEHLVYDVPATGSGDFYLEILRFSGSGAATVKIAASPIPPAPVVTRLAGTNRYETDSVISNTSYPAGSSVAVLCSGLSFPDGLAASSLAGALNAPILLTDPNVLPTSVGSEIQRLGADKIYIVGGTMAIGAAIEKQIRGYAPAVIIERVSGGNRYETAARVADKVHAITGTRPDMVFLASGEAFPDALALSPLAFATKTPILLVGKTVLPSATAAVLTRLRGGLNNSMDLVVAGGEAAISQGVAVQAIALAGGSQVRCSGATRYETALAIAEMGVFANWSDPHTVAVASGITFPDALGGAPLSGRRAGVLVLSPGTSLGTASTAYMKSFDFAIDQAWVLGGTAALPPVVATQIDTILRDTDHTYTH
ncbi:MAG: cell wall-binding repeat-containing protein [Coriobacteriia bacterium]